MTRLQQIANQDSGMLRFYRTDNGWTGQIMHVSNGTVIAEIHGASILEVQNRYTKWLYSPLNSQELSIEAANADTILSNVVECEADQDLISLLGGL